MRITTSRLFLLLALLIPWTAAAQTQDAIRTPDTITADEDTVTIRNLPSGRGTAAISVSGYCSCTLVIEGRVSASGDWEAIDGAPTIDADGVYNVTAAGLAELRVRADAWASGTTTISMRVSSAGGGSGGGSGAAGDVTSNGANIATAAKQDTIISHLDSLETIFGTDAIFGAAGTADTDVLSVQGIASMTPLLVNPGTAANVGIYVEDAAETAGGNLAMAGCVRRDTAASSSGATGDNSTINCDATGHVWVLDTNSAAALVELAEISNALDIISSSLAPESTHASAVIATGAGILGEAKDIDGSALPNVVTEGQAARVATTLAGALLNTLVHEDGLTSPIVNEDVAEVAGGARLAVSAVVRSTAAGSTATAGDEGTFNIDTLGRLWTRDGDPCADPARITHAAISESTAATNEVVALNGSDLIYVCNYKWVTTAANSLSWTRGTGSDCGTGTTAIEGAQPYAANGGAVESGGGHALFVVPAGNALCLVSSAATAHGGRVSYVRTAAP